uniref:Uncharacterized protein n=1 Tax=uncultured bacterium contig00023 TaxID=1181512 RepID=A0A806KHU0_9BACT|nr:hypothetical protein [uncultured bacterium contig00023]
MILQLICGILIMALSLSLFFVLRYMRKHQTRNDEGTQKA